MSQIKPLKSSQGYTFYRPNQLNCFEPVSAGVCAGLLLIFVIVASGQESKSPVLPKTANDPAKADTLSRTGTAKTGEVKGIKLPQEITIEKRGTSYEETSKIPLRDVRPGHQLTYGEQITFSRSVFSTNGEDNGSSGSLSLGIFGVNSEKKISEALGFEINQSVSHFKSITVDGNSCPDHDLFIVKTFQHAVAWVPDKKAEIPFKVLVDVQLKGINLCTPLTAKPS